jgi:hypothetical protein
MPSIPQSILWISLVVLWLFVLVPMLINKRDTVRPTSDVALSTRVLNGGGRSRLLRRRSPAAGHRHDPDWRADESIDLDEEFGEFEAEDYEEAVRAAVREAEQSRARAASAMVVAGTGEAITEPVYLDVDVVEEDSGALPVGQSGRASESWSEPDAESPAPAGDAGDAGDAAGVPGEAADDTYEYIDDTGGLEAEAGPVPLGRRRRLDSTTKAEAVSARKYRFRKRAITVLAGAVAIAAVLSLTAGPHFWWACGGAGAATLLYLAYLRRQTRIEEQVRRRRQQRAARTRGFPEDPVGRDERDERARHGAPHGVAGDGFLGGGSPYRRGRHDGPVEDRLSRPGVAVLDLDDEDPVFEHLDEVAYGRRGHDLPRASGQ